jgi:iron complex outermembrane receptor protein
LTTEFHKSFGDFFNRKNFNTSLMIKHTGRRYSDATNKEIIDSYAIADLKMDYSFENVSLFSSLKASLEIKNITNEKYVGAIEVSDDASQGKAAYIAGSPRSIAGSLTIMF